MCMVAGDLAMFLGACLVVFLSGAIAIKTLETITEFLRLTEFVVGFILVGVSTSLPELFVGVSSALAHAPALSFGNVIGANILNLTLVGGITIIFARTVNAEYGIISKDSWIMVGAASVPIILMLIGNVLSRIDGFILLCIFFIYARWLILKGKAYRKELKDRLKRSTVIISSFLFVISIILLYVGARMVVRYGSSIAVQLAVPAIFVGIFFISFGTTVPELVFGLLSVKKGHPEFVIGNITGSVVANSLLVLGATALIYPITANFFLFLTSAIFMFIMCFLFATFIAGKRLTWQEGVVMVLLYVMFLVVELNLKGFF